MRIRIFRDDSDPKNRGWAYALFDQSPGAFESGELREYRSQKTLTRAQAKRVARAAFKKWPRLTWTQVYNVHGLIGADSLEFHRSRLLTASGRARQSRTPKVRFALAPRNTKPNDPAFLFTLGNVTAANLRAKFGPANFHRSEMDQDDGYGAESWVFVDDKHLRYEVHSFDGVFRVAGPSNTASLRDWLLKQLRGKSLRGTSR